MSYSYGSQPPSGYPNPRDGIARAMLSPGAVNALQQIAQPPPVPPGQPQQIPGLGQVGDGAMSPPGGPQQAPPMGGGGQAGPVGLPGVMQPGQLPMGMNPQAVAGGTPALSMPPRTY